MRVASTIRIRSPAAGRARCQPFVSVQDARITVARSRSLLWRARADERRHDINNAISRRRRQQQLRHVIVADGGDGQRSNFDMGALVTKNFDFDLNCRGEDSSQADVYEWIEPLVPPVVEGSSFAVLAFGCSRTGKTYTLSGADGAGNQRGIIPRFLEDLLTQTSRLTTPWRMYDVRASVIEIDGDTINDLNVPTHEDASGRSGVKIVDDPIEGSVLFGASYSIIQDIHDAKDVLKVFDRAHRVKKFCHVVCTIYVRQLDRSETNEWRETILSKCQFVELASAELARASNPHQKSPSMVNQNVAKHFAVLTRALSDLGRGKEFRQHRTCKLTHILKNTLSPSGQLLLIGCVNGRPSKRDEDDLENSLATLRFCSSVNNRSSDAISPSPSIPFFEPPQLDFGTIPTEGPKHVPATRYCCGLEDEENVTRVADEEKRRHFHRISNRLDCKYDALPDDLRESLERVQCHPVEQNALLNSVLRVVHERNDCKRELQRAEVTIDSMELELGRLRRLNESLETQLRTTSARTPSGGAEDEKFNLVNELIDQPKLLHRLRLENSALDATASSFSLSSLSGAELPGTDSAFSSGKQTDGAEKIRKKTTSDEEVALRLKRVDGDLRLANEGVQALTQQLEELEQGL